jgi:hypothetical protein
VPLHKYQLYKEHIVQDKINLIVDYLNTVQTRCTYKAAAKALGITPQSLKKQLGDKTPANSWLVSPETGDPLNYNDEEKHPSLYRTKRIITSGEVLTRNLDL